MDRRKAGDDPAGVGEAVSNGASPAPVSRRTLFRWGAGAAVGVAGTTALAWRAVEDGDPDHAAQGAGPVAFDGVHQAGVTTPMQDHLFFAVFDVTTEERDELVALLTEWTSAARTMSRGEQVGTGAVGGSYLAPPDDTGEALGLSPGRLTVTFGFGPTLFERDGVDRFGLAGRRPPDLVDLPKFAGDTIAPWRQGGDICVQACADDPQVALHAVRNLARLGFGRAAMKWSQLGYSRSAAVGIAGETPRNLMGFKDGTANLDVDDDDLTREHLWVDDDSAETGWTDGGTYMVVRRINMIIETWDRTSLQEQENLIGRDKAAGAPLSGGGEFAPPDFAMRGSGGATIMPVDSHVALAHPSHNGGARMLRRGYNFADGTDDNGRMDAGLLFVAFVRSPATQFIPIQRRLALSDGLSEYLRHTGTGIFFVPPGTTGDGFTGSGLFT